MRGVPMRTGLLLAAVTLAACGGGGETAEPAQKLDIQVEELGEQVEVAVPRELEAGVTEMQFSNRGGREHSAQILRYDAGHTPQEAIRAGNAWGEDGKPLPDWLHLAGGFGPAEAGESRTGVVKLEPGSHIVLDLEAEGRPVYANFSVTGEPSDEGLPPTDGSIKAAEYSFSAAGLQSGSHRVVLDNVGKEPHHLVAAPLREGATIEDVRRFLRTEEGRPPIDESEAFDTAVIDGGTAQVLELDLKPGSYAFLCFVPDRAGGPPHAVKGMISEVQVR